MTDPEILVGSRATLSCAKVRSISSFLTPGMQCSYPKTAEAGYILFGNRTTGKPCMTSCLKCIFSFLTKLCNVLQHTFHLKSSASSLSCIKPQGRLSRKAQMRECRKSAYLDIQDIAPGGREQAHPFVGSRNLKHFG